MKPVAGKITQFSTISRPRTKLSGLTIAVWFLLSVGVFAAAAGYTYWHETQLVSSSDAAFKRVMSSGFTTDVFAPVPVPAGTASSPSTPKGNTGHVAYVPTGSTYVSDTSGSGTQVPVLIPAPGTQAPVAAPVTQTQSCPSGDTGTYPNCVEPVTQACPSGDTGTYPNCVEPVTQECPTGDTGTYPNCVAPVAQTCPTGDTGTYPDCVVPAPQTCPTGYTGTYPDCVAPVTPPSTPAPTPVVSFGQVYSGCATPSGSGGTAHYVDPVNGSDSGDGSQGAPWKTLQTVLNKDVTPTGPVMPGDTIYLMNGNYGAININNIVNSDFVTLAAAPGQTPVIGYFSMAGSSKWIINGIKFQALKNGFNALVRFSKNNDVVFQNNDISSADDSTASNWSVSDWQANAVNYGLSMDNGGDVPTDKCMAVTNNVIHNVYVGVGLGIDSTLFANNTIRDFSADALDYVAYNNILIAHNMIENNHVIDTIHGDAIQGFTAGNRPNDPHNNVTIDSNLVIRRTNPADVGVFDGGFDGEESLQGIDDFNQGLGDFYNIQITNNVVITDADQAMSFWHIHGALIANNTVLYDGGLPGNPGTGLTWLKVYDPSDNVVVKNNISDVLDIETAGVTTLSNNIADKQIDLLSSTTGKIVFNSKAGVYGDNNVLDPNLRSYMLGFDPANFKFNVAVTSGTPAYGLGAPLSTPTQVVITKKVTTPMGQVALSLQSLLASVSVGFTYFVDALKNLFHF